MDAPEQPVQGPVNNPLATLAAHLPADAYNTLEAVLRDLDQRTTALQNTPPPLTANDLRNTLEHAFASANFNITTPTQTVATAALQPRPGNLKVEPPHFHGKESEDVGAWISLTEDYLRGQHIPEADWPLQVPMLFRGEVLRWYVTQKRKLGRPFRWLELRSALEKKYDSPLRIETLRNELHGLQYKGNLVRYSTLFREIESQIPESDMTFGDRLANFLMHLPPDHARDIRRDKPTTVEEMYFSARELSRLTNLHKGLGHGGATSTNGQSRSKGKQRTTYSLYPTPSFPTAPAPITSSTNDPQPMDLDLMASTSGRGSGAGAGAGTGTSSGSSNSSRVRCYNCNRLGHLSKQCRLPRKPRPQELHLMATIRSEDEEDTEDEEEVHGDEELGKGEDSEEGLSSSSTLHVFSLDGGYATGQELPVFYVNVLSQSKKSHAPSRRTSAIIDTGAACCYVKPAVIDELGIKLFPITPRLIYGAGTTSTSNLAKFKIQIHGITRPITAYVLDNNNLRFDLIIGLDWLKKHNAQPDWKTSSWLITDVISSETIHLKPTRQSPLISPSSTSSTLDLGSEATYSRHGTPDHPWPWPRGRRHEHRRHSAAFSMFPAPLALFAFDAADPEPVHAKPRPLTSIKGRVKEAKNNLGERLHKLVKEKFPKLFRSKVCFADIPPGRIAHVIDTRDAQPVRARGRPHSPPEHEEVRQFVEDGLRDGLIEPSESPWSAPIIFAKKKDGSNRICVDYRKLNAVTVKNAYPLPRIDDTYQHLHGAQYFTTLDLKSGYWQIPIEESSREKTAFETRYGQYQFRVMEFGLCNAPATFQRFMNNVLRPYLDQCAMVYLDDIVIFSRSEQQHVQDVLRVLRTLDSHGLVLNEKKCKFAQHEIAYLGHIVSADGVRPDPAKIAAITEWPTPDNVTHVRGFLNLAGYYRRFIKGFARIAGPLYELLKGNPRKGAPVQWSVACDHAFNTLKAKLTSAPVLSYPRPWHLFVIDTDASGDAIGGILHQAAEDFKEGKGAEARFRFKESQLHPIAYESRRMSPTEQRYSAQEREMLAIDYCLQKWRGYVEGSPIVVRTDHESLKYFLTQKHLGRRLARFADNIAHFDVKIIYRPGRNQLAADALSRRPGHHDVPDTETLGPLFAHPMDSGMDPDQPDDIAIDPPADDRALEDEPIFRTLERWRQELLMNPKASPSRHGFFSQGGLLWRRYDWPGYGELVVRVPTTSADARAVILEVHREIGHLGAQPVVHALRTRVWMPNITKRIRELLSRCDNCQFTRREAPRPQPLHPLPRVEAFDVWSFDWIGPLPKSKDGNQYILTSIDHGTDLSYATAHPQRSHEHVARLLRRIITTHGKPKAVLTDNGEEFLSYAFQNYLRRLGIEHLRTSPYHPQTNGRLEKFNDSLVQVLARFVAPDRQDEWDCYLPDALLAHRAHVNRSTGTSPAYLAFGRHLRLPSEATYDALRRAPTDEEIERMQHARLERVQDLERFRAEANAKALKRLEQEALRREDTYRDRGIGIGDLVLRRTKDESKLHPRWDGPFIVHDLTDRNTYQLRTRGGYILRTLYNAERLKPYHSSEPEPRLWYSSAELQRRDAKARFERDLQNRRAG